MPYLQASLRRLIRSQWRWRYRLPRPGQTAARPIAMTSRPQTGLSSTQPRRLSPSLRFSQANQFRPIRSLLRWPIRSPQPDSTAARQIAMKSARQTVLRSEHPRRMSPDLQCSRANQFRPIRSRWRWPTRLPQPDQTVMLQIATTSALRTALSTGLLSALTSVPGLRPS